MPKQEIPVQRKKGGRVKNYAMQMLAGLMLFVLSVPAHAEKALEIGIWPYISTQAMITAYHPLQVYLEQRLHRPVIFVTATGQRAFVERTQKGEYQFVITAPHFARLAQQEAGYVPMLRPKRNSFAVFVVEKDSPLKSISELRGKTITLTDPVTMIAMLGLQALRDNGLQPGKNVTVHYAVSHNSAVLDVLRGESDAAVTGAIILDQLPDSIKNGVKILAIGGETSPMIYLANPQVPEQEAAAMTRILLDFVDHTPEGAKFVHDLGYQGLRPPTQAEMQSLDPLVVELKKLLKKSQ